jgi:subtilase family serine protease/flagellar hook assembly protein FlgD
MEHDGSSYNKADSDGIANYAPRAALAKRFYETHGDNYDFLVVFTNFEFETGRAVAFYNLVRNDTRGTGRPPADNGLLFGSPGRLKGYIDMAALERYTRPPLSLAPGDPGFLATLQVLAHELAHQWLAQPRFKDASGAISTDLLGQQGAHWSYLLDSDASVMYGSDWVRRADGSYEAVRVKEQYSALDLYLMGLLAPSKVGPITLLRNPLVDAAELPVENAVITATPQTISVDDIVAAEGARLPSHLSSQKEFRLGFVFLTAPGTEARPEDLAAIERIRQAFPGLFFGQTRGVAVADTTLAEAPSPAPVPTPDLGSALAFLLGAQSADGRWEDAPGTAPRDTPAVARALLESGQHGPAYDRAVSWIAAKGVPNLDFAARRVVALAPTLGPTDRDAIAGGLVLLQNADGGFGPGLGYASDSLDTALALRALHALEQPAGTPVPRALASLAGASHLRGGWAVVPGGEPSTLVTAEVLLALAEWKEQPAAQALIPGAVEALLARRNGDGGYGESPSTPYATALCLSALLRTGAGDPMVADTIAWLQAHQLADGSWGGRSYDTALVLSALRSGIAPNLVVSADSLVLSPPEAKEGDVVEVAFVVRNAGRAAAPATTAQLFDGDPSLGHIVAEAPVPPLDPGAAWTVTLSLATEDRAGTLDVFVRADGHDEVAEAREDDNTASRSLTVEGTLPDLAVEPGAISVSPDPPIAGEVAETRVVVRNFGDGTSAASLVRLYLGNPRGGGRALAAAGLPPIAAGGETAVSLSWDTTGLAGQQLLFAVADPDFAQVESDETNNEGALAVDVETAPPAGSDLAVIAVRPDPSAFQTIPQTIAVNVTVRNRGLTGATSTVALYDGDPESAAPSAEAPLGVGPRSSVTITLPYTVTSPGTRTLVAVADPRNELAEEREDDNRGHAVVADPENTLDLVLDASSVVASPPALTVGERLTVSAVVRNRGTAAFTDVPVVLSRLGGGELARTSVSLEPGQQTSISLSWVSAVTGNPLALLVQADPFGVLPELDETNNDASLSVVVRPSSQPNLRVSGADIAIAPDPPLEGGSASVSVVVRNTGTVPAPASRVAFFRGDPDDGGTLIDVANVPGLAAGGAATATVSWSPVSARGLTGIVVQVDPANDVAEFDETDNRAFRPFSSIGLPDVSLSAGDVAFTPAFPRKGQSVEVRAVVRSLGGRPSPASTVHAVEGDPASGTPVGDVSVPALDPGDEAVLTFTWTPSQEGERQISLIVDPEGLIPEADEGNNLARRTVVVQNADLYLTAPYFSPNGDGVLDETTLAWRTTAAVAVIVSDDRGQKVRTLAENAPAEGSVTWDGRGEEGGRILADGAYTLSLVGEGGVVLGRTAAVLDTNRVPIHEVAGPRRLAAQNLTCPLGNVSGPAFTPSEDEAIFVVQSATAPERPIGLVRVGPDGEFTYVSQDDWFAAAGILGPTAVSPDGRVVVVYRGSSLYLVDLETGERSPLTLPGIGGSSDMAWSPDGGLIAVSGALYRRNTSLVGPIPFGPMAWSPDGRYLAVGPMVTDRDLVGSWTLPGAENVDSVLVRQTTWREDGRVFFSLPPDNTEARNEFCPPGCALVYTPFVDQPGDFLDWLAPLGSAGWSPRGDQVLYTRFKPSADRYVTSVAREDGSGIRDIFEQPLTASPHASLGYLFETPAPGSGCSGFGNYDLIAVRNLDNLTADFQVNRLPGNAGVVLKGIAADRNLDRWQLEYATAPDAWHPIGPAFDVPVVDDVLLPWAPPLAGTFAVRLSVFDRAGNSRSRTRLVAWDHVPSVTNVTQSEFLISPNDDGVKDAVSFSYLVQEPTRVLVTIEGPARGTRTGPVVRSFTFEHAHLGSQTFTWDGRDENGDIVVDGRYQVIVNGLPFRVDVDTVPPDIAWSWDNVRSVAHDGLLAERLWHVVDTNLKSWAALLQPGRPPVLGAVPVYEPVRDVHGDVVYEDGLPKVRYVAGRAADERDPQERIEAVGVFPDATFTATDYAGNQSVAPILRVDPRLFLLGAGDSGSVPAIVRIAPPVSEDEIHKLAPLTTFVLAETLKGNPPEGEAVTLEYEVDGSGNWTDGPSFSTKEGFAAWDARFPDLGFDPQLVYKGRFACEAEEGRFESDAFRFRTCDRYARLDAKPGPPDACKKGVPTEFLVSGYAGSPFARAELRFVDSNGDPLRLGGHAIDPIALPRLPGEDRFGELLCVPCLNGVMKAVVTLEDGSELKSDTLPPSCQRLDHPISECSGAPEIQFEERGFCGDPNTLPVRITEEVGDSQFIVTGDPDGTPFEIARFLGTFGTRDPELGVVFPTKHDLVADVTHQPDRDLTIQVEIQPPARVGGPPTDSRYTVHIDKTAPATDVFRPVDGESICVDTRHDIPTIRSTVRARDRSPYVGLTAELNVKGVWSALRRVCDPTDAECQKAPDRIPQGPILDTDWDARGLDSGEYRLRLTFCDKAGNKTIVERGVILRRDPPYIRPLSVDRSYFSPNGDGRSDVVVASFRTAEALTVAAQVRMEGAGGPVVRRLFPSGSRPAGDFGVTWDGRKDDGTIAPDGRYWIEVEGVNGCGGKSATGLAAGLDNTPPRALLTAPAVGSTVTASVDVLGVAFDEHFASWRLEARPANGGWTEVARGTSPVGRPAVPGPITRWDTPSVAQPYELRLTVADQAENVAQTDVVVNASAHDRLDQVSANPSLFSPNGDGRRETTTLQYRLSSTARVRLEVQTPVGALVRKFEAGTGHAAGTYAFTWDGRDDGGAAAPDGEYRVYARAEDPAGVGVPEESAIRLEIDRVPPALVLESPAPDVYVDRDGTVVGSVDDPNLASWSLVATPTAGAVVSLAVGRQSQTLGDLATLSRLAEGRQSLVLAAEDAAENRSDRSVSFTVDSIPPAASIEAPLPGSVWPLTAPIDVRGTATDENLEDWKLYAGRGTDPATFFEIRRSTTGGVGIALGPWTVASLPEDDYTLRLVARDHAGHVTEARIVVTLAGLPTARIDDPAEQAYVTKPRMVVGRASDLHVDTWRLEAAPGPAATAFQWTTLATDRRSVEDGALAEWNPLPPDGLHTLRLTVRNQAGQVATAQHTVTVDTKPPAAPRPKAKVVRTGTHEASIVLTWDRNTEPDLAGYRVSRDGETLTGVIPDPTHTDPGHGDGVYTYAVTAEDRAGNVSAPGTVEVRVDLGPLVADLLSPSAGASVSGTVAIRGTAWTALDFKEYRVSIGQGTPPTFTLIRRSTLPVRGGALAEWTALGWGPRVIQLEAEDTFGNVARAVRDVVIDNVPPSAPVLLSVDPLAGAPDALRSIWRASPEPDVAGYLLYRNGHMANAPALTLGDLRPYLVPPDHYVDASLPDGAHCYRVVAMDAAGNLSPPSNEICRTLENRAPTVEIVEPPDGQRFEFPLEVRAETPDLDVASVQFQIRRHVDPPAAWQDLGAADATEPWATALDPVLLGLSFGAYDLRAIATDRVAKVGVSPVVRIVYGDTTPPAPPRGLAGHVDAHRVTLTWQPNAEPDVVGYHVTRDGVRLTSDPVPNPTYDDDRDPGEYAYTVSAIDADGNESGPSNVATAIVYAAVLDQPFPVTLAATADLRGTSRPDTTVDLLQGGAVLASVPAHGGVFTAAAVALRPDANILTARGRDADGNRSIPSDEVVVIANTAPEAVHDLAATPGPHEVALAWTASPEADVIGYAVRRDGTLLTAPGEQRDFESITGSSTAAASAPADAAFDQAPESVWVPDTPFDPNPSWEIQFPAPVLLESVELLFATADGTPTPLAHYAIDALWEGRYLRLTGALANAQTEVHYSLPSSFWTKAVRIRLDPGATTGLAEVRIGRGHPAPEASFRDESPLHGESHTYEVAAIDRYGAFGPWASASATVHRLRPPIGLVGVADSSDAVLTWTANTEPNLSYYDVYRFGSWIGFSATPSFRDPGLANGDYVYTVVALDTDGNESDPSNPATVTIAVPAPVAPVLRAVANARGAIDLDWGHPGAPRYLLTRFSPIGPGMAFEVMDRHYTDADVRLGVTYMYVVKAIDAAGNASPDSNEARATPERTEAPTAPVILFPTDAPHPLTLTTTATAVGGRTEEGTVVALALNGEDRGTAPARPPLVEERLPDLAGGAQQLILSPDGRRIAYQFFDNQAGMWRFAVREVGGGAARDLTDSLDSSALLLGFSPDGERILHLVYGQRNATGPQKDLLVLDLASGAVAPIEEGPDDVNAAAWSPDGTRVAYASARDGACRLDVRDLATGAAHPLDAGSSCPFTLRFSPAGDRIAFCAWTGSELEVRLVDASGGTSTVVESPASAVEWSPAGERLYFVAGAFGPVFSYDVASGQKAVVAGVGSLVQGLAVDPQGQWLSIVTSEPNGLALAAQSLVTSAEQRVSEPGTYPLVHQWTSSGALVVGRFATPELRTFPGYTSFRFDSVRLVPGLNALVARATHEESGLVSADSDPVAVTVAEDTFADLAVDRADVGSYPAMPLAGQEAVLSARVRNVGPAAAANVAVRLQLVDADGRTIVEQRFTLGSIAGGGSAVVAARWTPTASGTFTLRVDADPADAIVELSETNNGAVVAVVVPNAAGLVATLDVDRASYLAATPVIVTARIANAGQPFRGLAVLVVDDAAGSEVARLDERPIALDYGQTAGYTVSWNTGRTYAGDYRFRLSVNDAAGVGAAASHAFAILPEIAASSRLVADRATLPVGAPASFAATIRNEGRNAVLTGVVARFSVKPDGGTTALFASEDAVPQLLPGAVSATPRVWPVATPAGRYEAELRVLRGTDVLTVSTASFEVTADEGSVAGAIAATPGHVLQGDPFETPFTVTNIGQTRLAALSVTVEIVSGPAATVHLSQPTTIDLDPGHTVDSRPAFSASGLDPGAYTVRLRAGVPARTLARASLRVHGPIAAPSIDAPADGAVVATLRPSLVVNDAVSAERASLTYEFQLFADQALTVPLPGTNGIAETPIRTAWTVPSPLDEDRTYWWRARASDGFSISAWSAVARFKVDAANEPPQAPLADSPAPGATVAVRQPPLVVRNAFDPEGDTLVYDFRLGRDESFTDVLASASGMAEGRGLTTWPLPILLDEDATYCWTARANDGRAFSPWSAPACFRVHSVDAPPSAPVLRRPIAGVHVPTLSPALVVGPAVDPEGAPLVYRFEIDRTPAFDSPAKQASPDIPEGGAETSWTAPTMLADNTLYYWRAAASDGVSQGPWATDRFVVDLGNDPPSAPVLLDPVDDRAVTTATPTLRLRNARDPDGDVLTHAFEVRDAAGFVVAETSGVESGALETTWTVPSPLAENGHFTWRARAHDGHVAGPWSAPARFRVNAVRQAPTAPGPVAPAEGATLTVRNAALVVTNATSPDGLALTYGFELYDEGTTPPQRVSSTSGAPEGDATTSWMPPLDLPDGHYAWRAQAFDGELYGPWSVTARFTVLVDAPPLPLTNLTAVPGDARVDLSWRASTEPDVVGYRLFRGLQGGGPYQPVAETAETRFPDTGLHNGTTYYYVVQALDRGGHASVNSNEAAATPTAPPAPIVAEIEEFEPDEIHGECVMCPQGGRAASGRIAAASDTATVKPILECVVENEDHAFTALFGFENADKKAMTVGVGSQNKFSPSPQDRGQPTVFAPGRSAFPAGTFAVDFPSGNLQWTLKGKSVTASSSTKRCTAADPDSDCPDWVEAELFLPAPYDVAAVDLTTVRLAGTVPADPNWKEIEHEHEGDELHVRFPFSGVRSLLQPGVNTLAVSGRVSGVEFVGSSTIRLLGPEVGLFVTPRSLKRSSNGEDVMAELRVDDCLGAGAVDIASLRLNETVPVSRVVTVKGSTVKVKFARAAVAARLSPGEHVEVRVSGRVGGQPFVARDAIKVIP